MTDHHCLYQYNWIVNEWCACCAFDWLGFRAQNKAAVEANARAAYELVVESWCDEPLQLGPVPAAVVQLVSAPAGWSVEQVSEPSAN